MSIYMNTLEIWFIIYHMCMGEVGVKEAPY